MLQTMSKVRCVLQLEEENREALRLEAALTGKDMAELVDELIVVNFTASLEQIRARRAARSSSDDKPKPGRR